VDARSDLYSIGVILYECVTGRVPFEGNTFNELMFKIVLSDAQPPMELVPELDNAFGSIVMKAMARDVAQRFQTADEFAAALTAWMDTGANVSLPAPPPPPAFSPGRSRPNMQSGSDIVPGRTSTALPEMSPRQTATAGNWAATQGNGVPQQPAKNSLVIGAMAGGAVLLVAVVAVVFFVKGGTAAPPTADSAHSAATAATAAVRENPTSQPTAVPEPPPAEHPTVTPPAATVAIAPATASAVTAAQTPPESDPAHHAAKLPPGKKPPAKPPGKPGAKPAAGGEPYFGY
jgi:hypothetical protein